MVGHNHPSDNTELSQEDIEMTKRLKGAYVLTCFYFLRYRDALIEEQ
ncbi:JAB domain-containing protein [Exiguobacterium indicum]